MLAARLPPNLVGHFHDSCELSLNNFHRQARAGRAGKAALRREAELFDRHEPRSLSDSLLEQVSGFQIGQFGRDESQHYFPALRHKPQRREVACSWGIVFEKEPVDVELVEQPFSYRLVAAVRHAMAAVPAA